MPDTLPTCWYCSECGQPFKENRSHHSWPIQRVICKGTLEQVTLVPPVLSPEQRRALLGILGFEVREGYLTVYTGGEWLAHPLDEEPSEGRGDPRVPVLVLATSGRRREGRG